jgi:hypothetical protein
MSVDIQPLPPHPNPYPNPWPREPIRMSDDALRQFVEDWLARKIYSIYHGPKDDPFLAFVMLKLVPPPVDFVDQVGCVYEYIREAGPFSVNGHPMFLSHHFMHADDWQVAVKTIRAEEERRKGVELVR